MADFKGVCICGISWEAPTVRFRDNKRAEGTASARFTGLLGPMRGLLGRGRNGALRLVLAARAPPRIAAFPFELDGVAAAFVAEDGGRAVVLRFTDEDGVAVLRAGVGVGVCSGDLGDLES